MSTLNRRFLRFAVLVLILAAILSSTGFALAAGDFGASEAAQGTRLIGVGKIVDAQGEIIGLVGRVVGYGLSLLGIVFFGLTLYAAIRWMTAMGKAEEVTKAKEILEAAIIGLVIVAASYAIADFVFKAVAP